MAFSYVDIICSFIHLFHVRVCAWVPCSFYCSLGGFDSLGSVGPDPGLATEEPECDPVTDQSDGQLIPDFQEI